MTLKHLNFVLEIVAFVLLGYLWTSHPHYFSIRAQRYPNVDKRVCFFNWSVFKSIHGVDNREPSAGQKL